MSSITRGVMSSITCGTACVGHAFPFKADLWYSCRQCSSSPLLRLPSGVCHVRGMCVSRVPLSPQLALLSARLLLVFLFPSVLQMHLLLASLLIALVLWLAHSSPLFPAHAPVLLCYWLRLLCCRLMLLMCWSLLLPLL